MIWNLRIVHCLCIKLLMDLATVDFEYPVNMERFQQIQDSSHLKSLLKEESRLLKINKQGFRITCISGRYIYCRCSCRAQLKYKRLEDSANYELILVRNRHYHKPIGQSDHIANFMRNMPTTIQLSSLKKIVKNQFSISDSQFYYYNKKFLNERLTFSQLIDLLDHQKFDLKYRPFPLVGQPIPDVIIACSQQMRNLFKKFGQIISFDITYNIVKESYESFDVNGAASKPKKWGLALFAGKNGNNRAVVFAVALINTEDTQTLVDLFGSFFDLMKEEPTANVISDQQWSIIAALQELKARGLWQGEHFLDSFHILRNLKKNTKNTKLFDILHQAMMETSSKAYNSLIQSANNTIQCENDAKVIDSFLKYANKYCFSQTPAVFHGLALSNSYHQKLHDIVKCQIKFSLPAANAFQKAIRICDQINQESVKYVICKEPLQTIFDNPRLKHLRFSVCENIFRKLIKIYAKALPLNYHERNYNQWIFDRPQDAEVTVRQEKLSCTCNFKVKTGLPCAHILKIALQIRQNISQYVDKRWNIVSRQSKRVNCVVVKSKCGRPRNSRRNH